MRYATIAVLWGLIGPGAVLAKSAGPTTAPAAAEAKARIGAIVADLFNQPRTLQQQARQQLETEPDLPLLLATLLQDNDPAIRRTSLLLLRDNYGDWPIVAAVQSMLRSELAQGDKADAYIVAACCDILADWPRWDSIPVLLNAMRTNQQVSGAAAAAAQETPAKPARAENVAVWHEADAALRLISGEWPMPEPDAAPDPVPPGSPQDKSDNEKLQKAWAEWWANSTTLAEPLPQVRAEFTWTVPAGMASNPQSPTVTAASSLLWVRPTGSVHYSRTLGTAPSADEPAWKWDDRTRRQCEFHLNAIQADVIRSLAGDVSDAPSATTWAISRPPGLPANWHGRLQLISPFGDVTAVDLAETGTPGAVRPPATAIQSISEMLTIPTLP